MIALQSSRRTWARKARPGRQSLFPPVEWTMFCWQLSPLDNICLHIPSRITTIPPETIPHTPYQIGQLFKEHENSRVEQTCPDLSSVNQSLQAVSEVALEDPRSDPRPSKLRYPEGGEQFRSEEITM